MKNKVVIFLQDFAGGGAEKMMVNLANQMHIDDEIELELFVVRKVGPYLALLNPDIKIVESCSSTVLSSIFSLARYFKSNKPDVVFCTLKHVNIAAVFAKFISFSKVKVVIREACHLIYDPKASLRQRISFRLIPFFYPFADKIIAVSEGVKESLEGNLYRKASISVANNPVLSEDIKSKYNEPLNDPQYPVDSSDSIIISSGRLEHQKDYETLLLAFERAKRTKDNMKLFVMGTGSMLEYYLDLCQKLKIEDDVVFLGFKTNPYQYLKGADLFVLSSRYEGSPNVLVEAMGAGIPVISTDCPSGPMETLEGGKNGILIEIGDVQAMAKAILSQLENPIGVELGLKKVKEFEASQVAKDYMRIAFE